VKACDSLVKSCDALMASLECFISSIIVLTFSRSTVLLTRLIMVLADCTSSKASLGTPASLKRALQSGGNASLSSCRITSYQNKICPQL
jgi:hypothetical protein